MECKLTVLLVLKECTAVEGGRGPAVVWQSRGWDQAGSTSDLSSSFPGPWVS